jgi:hypothetical protein
MSRIQAPAAQDFHLERFRRNGLYSHHPARCDASTGNASARFRKAWKLG